MCATINRVRLTTSEEGANQWPEGENAIENLRRLPSEERNKGVRERASLDEFHRQIWDALSLLDRVDRDGVRMIERGYSFPFAAKSVARSQVFANSEKDLQGNYAIESCVIAR